jgi:hypothetical protein
MKSALAPTYESQFSFILSLSKDAAEGGAGTGIPVVTQHEPSIAGLVRSDP